MQSAMTRQNVLFSLVLTSLFSCAAFASERLEVTSAGPIGEVSELAEANEIRVVFSEPMVAIGRIPDPVRAPFLRISPAIKGSFRWSGTRTLIFTPDPKTPLPFATKYDVVIDASAVSVNGSKLSAPYLFSFTTPTVRLLQTKWYRKNGKASDPVVVVLRFNQPVDRASIASHIRFDLVAHDWTPPELAPADAARLQKIDPVAVPNFNAKVELTKKTVAANGPVLSFLTDQWNRKTYPPSPDQIVFETRPGILSDSWIRVLVAPTVRGKTGAATPPAAQEFTIQLEPTFFVNGFRCSKSCEPDEYNPLTLRSRVDAARVSRASKVTEVVSGKETPLTPNREKKKDEGGDGDGELGEYDAYHYNQTSNVTLEDLGYSAKPARNYRVEISPDLQSEDGQTLGYRWMGEVENWHKAAFTSFGDGHGVWESSGGTDLPYYALNLANLMEWSAPLRTVDLMPVILKLKEARFATTPPGNPRKRSLATTPDGIQSFGLSMKSSLSPAGKGLVWAGLKDGDPIARSRRRYVSATKSTIVQVTNLGISVKDSPLNTLIFVTELDSAKPVAGARVAIRTLDNRLFWEGTTNEEGLAIAPDTNLLRGENWWELQFIVTAEKEGDVAYVASDWNDGIRSWDFGHNYNPDEAKPLLRGTVFTDRGVYKQGEQVHVKAVVRKDTQRGVKLLASGTVLKAIVKDSRDNEVDSRSVVTNEWSSAEWTFNVPKDGPLGDYILEVSSSGIEQPVTGGFLVAAYRRPDFRVDTTLTTPLPVAGTGLNATATGRYLFGGVMAKRPVRWTLRKNRSYELPSAIRERFPSDRFVFMGWDEIESGEGEEGDTESPEPIATKEASLDQEGKLQLELPTSIAAGLQYQYTFEAEVTDISRQKIASRRAVVVHPMPFYIGVKSPPYFVSIDKGIDTEIVAANLDGTTAAGVSVDVTLHQVQWNSIRRAEGNGMYTWDYERKETRSGNWKVESATQPVPLHIPVAKGGYYLLRARAKDAAGRSTKTTTSFYVLGPGYTAWARYDHNRIELVPEKSSYKPGETARIMIKSPWESATALLTTEREGIRTSRQFDLKSTQTTVEVPITEEEIPNVYVSVLLLKGRTSKTIAKDGSDPGKPAFRLGYTELIVEQASRRLNVEVKANRDEYRPASKAKIDLAVTDFRGKPARAEVTLWAVDYGVLSLTAYATPDVLGSVYVQKALQVMNSDSRQKIISRRVLTPKGGAEGGGGGMQDPGTRRDFRALAFWLGSVTTDANGRATRDVTLPESLTTYRIMAVAADKESRFGKGESEIRTNKPLLLKGTFPRFLAVGDKVLFGAAVHSQLTVSSSATVTIRSLNPASLAFTGETSKKIELPAGGSAEVRFDAAALAVGDARVEMTVKGSGESDAFEEIIPVRLLVTPESVAAYGETEKEAKEAFVLPAGVVPGFGGMQVELASTAMVGLSEGARYLVDYPYGCAEQRASATLALMLAADLGGAFPLDGIDAKTLKSRAQESVTSVGLFHCPDGGFPFWRGECWQSSPYLSSYLVHVLQRARALGYRVNENVLEQSYGYLEARLAEAPPTNEGWWPAYTAWQAFAVKVLAEGGRDQDSHVTRLYGYIDRMPIFAQTFLWDAMYARGEKGARPAELRRRIMNAILPEGGSAHVNELRDPYLDWFWSSSVRTTAIVLGSIVRNSDDTTHVSGLVRWLMNARRKGRWGNTQENAWAMGSLVDYYIKYERVVPDFQATVLLGEKELTRQAFEGRSTSAVTKKIPMAQLRTVATGQQQWLFFRREGAGKLFYGTRLTYALEAARIEALDSGIYISRKYELEPSPGKSATPVQASTSFSAGSLVKITLELQLTKERRWVAVTDPLPAGFEAVESWFATTASDIRRAGAEDEGDADWTAFWRRGGFDHVERHDDRVDIFATRLGPGRHVFSYVARATTSGTFRTAPAHGEEMYEPEVFGRTASTEVEVKP